MYMKSRTFPTTMRLIIVLLLVSIAVALLFFLKKTVISPQAVHKNVRVSTAPLFTPTPTIFMIQATQQPIEGTMGHWVWTKISCMNKARCFFEVCSNADNNNCIKCTSKADQSGNVREPFINENPYRSNSFTCEPVSPML